MSVIFQILPEQRALHAQFVGDLTVEEILKFVEASRPYDAQRMIELLDFSAVTSVFKNSAAPTTMFADIKRIVDYVQAKTPVDNLAERTAMVVTRDLYFGLARMYQALAEKEEHEIRIFRNVERAVEWLEIEVPPNIPSQE